MDRKSKTAAGTADGAEKEKDKAKGDAVDREMKPYQGGPS